MLVVRFISLLTLAANALAQRPAIQSVRNAASLNAPGPSVIAPQMLIAIFGEKLAVGIQEASVAPLPSTLAGASVTIGGMASRNSATTVGPKPKASEGATWRNPR